jgi:DNA-binding transcriptional LysR family regulator
MDHITRVGVFIEVVKNESFAGAARSLGLTGPAISKQVQSLEENLGVRLLNRTTRHVSLTEEGAVYFNRARKALEDLGEAEQQIRELRAYPMGKLKINAPMSFGSQFLTKPIAEFAKQHTHVNLEVDFSDRWVDVVAEGYDVVIRITSPKDSNLVARKLAPCPLVLCASEELINDRGFPESADELENFPAVVYNRHAAKEVWSYIDLAGKKGSATLNRKFAANTAEMQVDACLAGIGVSVLPIFSAHQYIKSGRLVRILPELKTEPERGIYAMYPQNRYLSTRTRLFIEWLSKASEDFTWC